MKELIEVLRVQKHDFLNHLQVISGYLQLNKADKAKDYIQHVSNDIYHLGMITRLKVPEVALNLLILKNEAVQHGIRLDITMSTEMNNSSLSGELLGPTVYKLVEVALEQAGKSGINNPCCQVKIASKDAGYIIRIVFPGQELDLVDKYVELENCTYKKHGGAICFKANSPMELEINILVPRG